MSFVWLVVCVLAVSPDHLIVSEEWMCPSASPLSLRCVYCDKTSLHSARKTSPPEGCNVAVILRNVYAWHLLLILSIQIWSQTVSESSRGLLGRYGVNYDISWTVENIYFGEFEWQNSEFTYIACFNLIFICINNIPNRMYWYCQHNWEKCLIPALVCVFQ